MENEEEKKPEMVEKVLGQVKNAQGEWEDIKKMVPKEEDKEHEDAPNLSEEEQKVKDAEDKQKAEDEFNAMSPDEQEAWKTENDEYESLSDEDKKTYDEEKAKYEAMSDEEKAEYDKEYEPEETDEQKSARLEQEAKDKETADQTESEKEKEQLAYEQEMKDLANYDEMSDEQKLEWDKENKKEETPEVKPTEVNMFELSDGVFESKEEFKETAQLLKDNPELLDMLDYYKKEGNLLPYLEATQIDIEGYSDIDILQEAFKSENEEANLSKDDLLILFNDEVLSKYDLDSEDENKVKLGKLKMARDAAEHRKKLKEYQEGLKLPTIRDGSAEDARVAEEEKAKAELSKAKNRLAFDIRKQVKDGRIEVEISEGNSVTLEFSPRKVASLLDKTSDLSLFSDDEGNFDLQMMAMIANKGKFVKSVIDNSETGGQKKFVNKFLKNRKTSGKSPEGKGKPDEKPTKVDVYNPKHWKGAKIIRK